MFQVQAVLRRHWSQYQMQFTSVGNHSDALRSASYTASSITEVQATEVHSGFLSEGCHTELMNGKSCPEDTAMFRHDNPFN